MDQRSSRTARPPHSRPASPLPSRCRSPANGIITNPDPNSNYFTLNKNFKNPYVESWNFAIQRALPFHFVLDAAYVGNHGVNSVVNYNLNAATTLNTGNKGLPQANFNRTASTNLLFAGYSTMYNALQVKIDRRYTSGLLVTTAYTWGKGMGFQTGDDGGPLFYINFHRNYARNDYDRTHTFVQSVIYDLPFGKGKRWMNSGTASKLIGGWRTTTIMTLMSGTPLNFTYSSSGLNSPGNTQTPDQIAPITYPHGINVGNQWFSTASFGVPATGVFGSLGRNPVSGPGFFNLDASLFKIFSMTERINMEIRGEALSITNTPQFSNPNTTLGNANFGYITGGGGGRTLQLGLKVNF